MKQINLTLTIEQATTVSKALDLYNRLCIGQLNEVSQLIRCGTIPVGKTNDAVSTNKREIANLEQCDKVDCLVNEIKVVMGYPVNGNNGISHSHVDINGKRAYEISKVLDKTLAEERDPNPRFKGVNYDGLIVRYTTDKVPEAVVSN